MSHIHKLGTGRGLSVSFNLAELEHAAIYVHCLSILLPGSWRSLLSPYVYSQHNINASMCANLSELSTDFKDAEETEVDLSVSAAPRHFQDNTKTQAPRPVTVSSGALHPIGRGERCGHCFRRRPVRYDTKSGIEKSVKRRNVS